MKKILLMILSLSLLVTTGCFGSEPNSLAKIEPNGMDEIDSSQSTLPPSSEVIAFEYPANPPQALHAALQNAAYEYDLEFIIGEINAWETSGGKYQEIPVHWRGEKEHSCLISFFTPIETVPIYGANRPGRDDASFTIAFQDPEAMEDMVTLAVPVLQYADPHLDWNTALAMAEYLLDTLTVDGFSEPIDVKGYQFQLHYTNPHEYYQSGSFVANMGLSVKALSRIWGDFDMSGYSEMTPALYSAGGRNGSPEKVHVVGNVTDWYKKLDSYGTPETFVTVEYGDGATCRLRMNYLMSPYEFVLGGKYEFYVMLSHPRGPALIYATQLSLPK